MAKRQRDAVCRELADFTAKLNKNKDEHDVLRFALAVLQGSFQEFNTSKLSIVLRLDTIFA